MSRVLVINGPNLDQLGRREPSIYGHTTLVDLEEDLRVFGRELEVEVDCFQSNNEASLIERLHGLSNGSEDVLGVVINPGGLTHYSRALGDALGQLPQPVVEVHISNVLQREPFRRRSALVSHYRIYGRGIEGYSWAIRHLVNRLSWKSERFQYGSLPDQYGDLRRAAETPQGLVVLVHGGLWGHQWTADMTESIAIDLTRRGWATFNLEYRRIGLGGGWPETFLDLQQALKGLPEMFGFPPEATVLLGHSAGASMVLWAAASHPGMVLALAPHPDLVAAAQDPVWSPSLTKLLAGDRPPPEAISPQHRAAPLGPTLVAAARDDDISPLNPIRAYAERFEGTDFLLCEGDHMSFLEPSSNAWRLVIEWLDTRKATL